MGSGRWDAAWLRQGLGGRGQRTEDRGHKLLAIRLITGLFNIVNATLEIPELLLRAAEQAAIRKGLPLEAFVADAIQAKLSGDAEPPVKPWAKHFGSLKHLHDESARIDHFISEEFRTVEPENWR